MTQLGPYTQGEIPPPLVYQFLDNDGVKIPITDYLGAFVLKKPHETGDQKEVEVDEANSTVTYTWVEDDLDTSGAGSCQFWVGDEEGTARHASPVYEFDIDKPVGGIIPDFTPAS